MAFVVKTTDGQVGELHCDVSGTNTEHDIRDLFDSYFFVSDPKLTYHFTPEQWKA